MSVTKFLGGLCGLAFLFCSVLPRLAASNKPSAMFAATFLLVGLAYLGIRSVISALVD